MIIIGLVGLGMAFPFLLYKYQINNSMLKDPSFRDYRQCFQVGLLCSLVMVIVSFVLVFFLANSLAVGRETTEEKYEVKYVEYKNDKISEIQYMTSEGDVKTIPQDRLSSITISDSKGGSEKYLTEKKTSLKTVWKVLYFPITATTNYEVLE